MLTGWIEIELRSELITATGDTTQGLIDIEVAHEQGLPIIPAKRLKGSLLESGKELVDWGVMERTSLQRLFGRPGSTSSSPLQIYDAHLYKVPDQQAVENYNELIDQLKQHPLKDQQVLEHFTSLLTRTAVEVHDGSAKDHSLRTMRAVNQGLVLRSRIEINGDFELNEEELEKTLRLCTKGLRHLGLSNTRGSGEVRCKLVDLQKSSEQASMSSAAIDSAFEDIGNGSIIASFRLELEQPIVVAGRRSLESSSEDWIPGSALLGAFAGLYIKDQGLGENAHKDEVFSRIFLREGVHFGYAMPLVGDRVFAPCPAMWQQEKYTEQGYDLLHGKPKDSTRLRSIGGLVHGEASTLGVHMLYQHKVDKQMRMHHARARNRAFGRALGPDSVPGQPSIMNPAERGQLYQYESIAAGQVFYGILQGKREDVTLLLELAAQYGNRLRIGRSRTAEYGTVRFSPVERQYPVLLSLEKYKEPASRMALLLVTPMLLLDGTGRPDPDPQWLCHQLEQRLGCKVELESVRLRYTNLSGYNAKWKLPKPQRAALDAGSSLVLKLERPIDVQQLEDIFWGWDTGEGLGQVRAVALHDQPDSLLFTLQNVETEKISVPSSHHPFLTWLIEQQALRQQMQQERVQGMKEAERVLKQFGYQIQEVGLTQIQKLKKIVSNSEAITRRTDDKQKRLMISKLKDPCEGKHPDFIQSYWRTIELSMRKHSKGAESSE